LKERDYKKAADEMLDSRWAKQTPNRAKELAEIMRSL
jgi:lysozyme